ncbi:FAD-dependent monooxygenase [Egicoccus sp. AB-alg6-2]|uniref:FAD-dependent monooxygenase n=1 Tax=Egicoccus sp. AB-alg6-2 TaxID=3242692 RepID=UPI00359DB8D4
MASLQAPVVVVGAGIGGLTTAIALDRLGLPVEVYERAPALAEVGAGIGLWPNAVRALDRLGVGDAVRSLAVPGTTGSARTPSGKVLLTLPAESLHVRYGAPTTGVMRAEVQRRLAERFGTDRIHLGRELVGFEQEDEHVRARFLDGSDVEGSVLVGADGLRSTVRSKLLADGPPRYRGDTAWRGLAPWPADEPLDDVFETVGRGARFGVFPLHDGRIMWFAGAVRPEGERDGPDVLDRLRTRFADWHHPIPRVLERTDPASILRNDIYDRPVGRRWVDGRVALLGDAAHPMGPDLGQGACQAIEDAETLALALRTFVEPRTALRVYERIRVRRVRTVGRIVGATSWLASRQHPVVCSVRDAVLAATPSAVARRQTELVAGWDPPERLRAPA